VHYWLSLVLFYSVFVVILPIPAYRKIFELVGRPFPPNYPRKPVV